MNYSFTKGWNTMIFKEIQLTLPGVVQKVYEIVHTVDPQAFIAGGFITDSYLQKPFKDVDLFIDYTKMQQTLRALSTLGVDVVSITDEYTSFMNGEHGVYQFEYEQVVFQCVFQELGLRTLDHFDLCFREGYHLNGKSYLSEGALADIHAETFNIGIMHDPFATIKRLILFQEKYQYEIGQAAYEKLAFYFKSQDISFSHVKRYTERSTLTKEQREKVLDIYNTCSQLPFNEDKAKLFSWMEREVNCLTREEYNALYAYKGKYEQIILHQPNENPYEKAVHALEKEIQDYIAVNKVKLLFSFPKNVTSWMEQLENSNYLQTDFKKEVEHLYLNSRSITEKTLLEKLIGTLRKILLLEQAKKQYTGSFEIKLSSLKAVFREMDMAKYLANHYIHVTIDGRFEMTFDTSDNYQVTDSFIQQYHMLVLQPIAENILREVIQSQENGEICV